MYQTMFRLTRTLLLDIPNAGYDGAPEDIGVAKAWPIELHTESKVRPPHWWATKKTEKRTNQQNTSATQHVAFCVALCDRLRRMNPTKPPSLGPGAEPKRPLHGCRTFPPRPIPCHVRTDHESPDRGPVSPIPFGS